jgi:hypothetical protein
MSSLPYPISGAGTAFPSWRTWVHSRILSVEQGLLSLPDGHEFTPVSYQWSRDCFPFLKYMSSRPYPISGAGTAFPSWRTWVHSRFFLCHMYCAHSLVFFKKNTLSIFYCQQLYKQWIWNKLSTYEVFSVTYKSLKRQHITNT